MCIKIKDVYNLNIDVNMSNTTGKILIDIDVSLHCSEVLYFIIITFRLHSGNTLLSFFSAS